MSFEVHSEDRTRWVSRSDEDGWEIGFDGHVLKGFRTREEARQTIRSFKRDPGLVEVALVHLT